MNKTLKLALAFATFALPSFSGFAQDDIYYNPDEDPEVSEEQVEQEAQPAQNTAQVSRHAYDTDTLIASDASDYVYSRRLNRFHDADLPVYTSESANTDGDVNVTNIYVINENPYYTYYRPGWSWRWGYYTGYYGYGYYTNYDPWWDGYYYRHSSYWGPGWGYYGYYGYYGYGYPYHHHHYYGGYRPAGTHYYGHKHLTPYYNRHSYSRNNMLGNRSSLQKTNRYNGRDTRGGHRGGVSNSTNSTRSYGAQSRGNINGDSYRSSYSGRGSRTNVAPSNSTRSYRSSSPNNGSSNTTRSYRGSSSYNNSSSNSSSSNNSTRSYRSSSSSNGSSNTTRSYSSGSSSSSSSSRSYGGDSRGSSSRSSSSYSSGSSRGSSSFGGSSSRGGSYGGGSSRGGRR
ncbi:MAG: hypothetical protein MJZ02_02800 [Paludibacteraceae bacterium]|nr:hypothetical protein [Paludibacteraceae bacterium]